MHPTIAVLGAGAWGTALSVHLARAGARILLWEYHAEQAQLMQQARVNQRYLPGVILPPDTITVSADLHDILSDQVDDVLLVTPSNAFASTLQKIKPFLLQKQCGVTWATKGLTEDARLLSEVASNILGSDFPLAVLSGPSFAKELAAGFPTAVTLSGMEPAFIERVHHYFHHHHLRIYTNTDLIGTQLGGALKNVLAIAAGISDGLGFGANARAALITRGLAEMMRLGEIMGAKRDTLMGLAGLGDLVLTCTDNLSRNRRFGLGLGKGLSVQQVLDDIGQVVEGVDTAAQALLLAQKYHIELPITTQVVGVLTGKITPQVAVSQLFARDAKAE